MTAVFTDSEKRLLEANRVLSVENNKLRNRVDYLEHKLYGTAFVLKDETTGLMVPFEEEIIRYACIVYMVDDANKLKEKCRKREVVSARYMCYWVLRNVAKWSTTKLGEYFNRDHSSVVTGLQSLKDLCDTDKHLKLQIELAVGYGRSLMRKSEQQIIEGLNTDI